MGRFPGFSLTIRFALVLVLLAGPGLGSGSLAAGKTADISPETLAQHPELQELRDQVQADPENSILQAELGNLYALLGWDDLAEASYLEAVRLDENLYEAWTNLGTVYSRQEKLSQAEKSFRKAIALQPRAALAYYNLGTVLDRGNRYDEALQAYKTAITYEPELLDPAINPQVVNNRHLTSIRLLSYLEGSGSGSLPLESFSEEERAMAQASLAERAAAEASLAAATAAGTATGMTTAMIHERTGKPLLGTLVERKETRSERRERKRREKEAAAATAAQEEPAPAS